MWIVFVAAAEEARWGQMTVEANFHYSVSEQWQLHRWTEIVGQAPV